MKKIIIFLSAFLCCFHFSAKELSTKQLEIRLQVFNYLLNEDKSFDPKIDKDGDINFQYEGFNWYFILAPTWNSPVMSTIYLGFSYGATPASDILKCIPTVLQVDGVKLRTTDEHYILESDILINDFNIVKGTFKVMLNKIMEARNLLNLCLDNDLVGVDFFSHKQTVHKKAIELLGEENYDDAFNLLKWLSEHDYLDAHIFLGLLYQEGKGTEQDVDKMRRCYLKGIEQKDYRCAYFLADYYKSVDDMPKAIEYYKIASSYENIYRCEAFYELGKMYEEGRGVGKSLNDAVNLYQQSVRYASELRCDARIALLNLKKTAESVSDFTNASSQISTSGMTPEDMYERGLDYEEARPDDIQYVSMPLAFAYYSAAAKRSHVWSCLKLAYIYEDDFFPYKNEKEAFSLYKKSIGLLKKEKSAEAMYELGMIYLKGKSVDRDVKMASAYLQNSADQGNVQAAYQYGNVLKEGNDFSSAFKYFKQSAEGGIGMAMYELAYLYDNGLGTSKDSSLAAEWYRKCIDADCEASDEAVEAVRRLESQGEKES